MALEVHLPSPWIKFKRVFIVLLIHVNRGKRCHDTPVLRNQVPWICRMAKLHASDFFFLYMHYRRPTIPLPLVKNSPLISMSLTDFLQMPLTILAILRVSLITFQKGNKRKTMNKMSYTTKNRYALLSADFACGS